MFSQRDLQEDECSGIRSLILPSATQDPFGSSSLSKKSSTAISYFSSAPPRSGRSSASFSSRSSSFAPGSARES